LTISVDVIHHEQYVYSVSTVFRLIQYREKVSNSIFIFRAISLTSVGKPRVFFYTFYLVRIWHCRIKLFLRHLPNCPCSNFSLYVDLLQEISPRIAKQLRFQVKLHHLRRKCKSPGIFTNGIPAMKNPDAHRIFFPEFFGGKYKSLKKHNSRRIIS
jgi:hypothetical protein